MLAQNRALKRKLWELEVCSIHFFLLLTQYSCSLNKSPSWNRKLELSKLKLMLLRTTLDWARLLNHLRSFFFSRSCLCLTNLRAENNKIPPKKKGGDKIKKLLVLVQCSCFLLNKPKGNDYQAEELIEMEGITIVKSEYGSLEVKGGTSEKLIAWLYDCNVPGTLLTKRKRCIFLTKA